MATEQQAILNSKQSIAMTAATTPNSLHAVVLLGFVLQALL
jgi:hypothetical protein